MFPGFPDTLTLPPGYIADGTEAPPDVKDAYLRHCLPSVQQIVEKVESVLGSPEGEGLKYVYVMTNGGEAWAEELKVALYGMRGVGGKGERWEKVATRRDLVLSWDQTFVSQAVDMVIGQRAQVLIGNGVRFKFVLSLLSRFVSLMEILLSVLEHDFEHRDVADGQRVTAW